MSNSTTSQYNRLKIFGYIKALLISLLISLGLVLLFAFIIKGFNVPDEAILPVNICIKIISIFIGIIILLKGSDNGLISGILFGFIYIVLSYLLFSILSGDFSITSKFIFDILFGLLIGGISSIIVLNIRK